jgi:1,4-dihydroxy-2-naphthoate polyprenyltransferase
LSDVRATSVDPHAVPTTIAVPRKSARALGAFIRLGRPKFLAGGFAFYGLGAVIGAYSAGRIDWKLFAWGQAAATTIQLMTHYANDYFDLEADKANRTPTAWSGGSRVLPNGELAPQVALTAALVLFTAAAALALLLATGSSAGARAAPLFIAALGLAWAYSAPPLRLHARGLGELDVALVMTFLLPLAASCLQTRGIDPVAVVALLPLCLLQMAMLLAVDLPDEAGDAAVGKRTLVVRLGASRARRLYGATLALVYVLLPVWWILGLPGAAVLALAPGAPWAAWLARFALRGHDAGAAASARGIADAPGRLAFGTVALLFLSACAELAAFLGLWLWR